MAVLQAAVVCVFVQTDPYQGQQENQSTIIVFHNRKTAGFQVGISGTVLS